MENDGSWTVSGYKEAMEVLHNFKDLRKLGIRTCHFQCYFVPLASTSSILSAIFTGVCGLPGKLSLALVLCLYMYVLHMILKLAYKVPEKFNI